MKLRWLTWWPAPYWVDRFNHLAQVDGLDFEAIFLAGSTTHQEWTLDRSEWKFRYKVLEEGPTPAGYHSVRRRIHNISPFVAKSRKLHVVMPYAHPTFLFAAMIAVAKRVPYYLFVANTKYDLRPRSAIRDAMKHIVFKRSAGCLATGPLQKEYADYYAGSVPVSVVGNPVDMARLRADAARLLPARDEARRKRGWGDSVVIAYSGRLAAEKDLATLFHAVEVLRAEARPVVVALAGSGPLERELRALARDLEVPAEFLGFLDGETLSEFYACADVFVLPSLSEPWGLVVNEAMAFALPVVTSNRVGAQHLVSGGKNGYTFAAGDADALARTLRPLVEDAALRRRMGECARASIEGETIASWADNVLDAVSSPPPRVKRLSALPTRSP